MIVPMKKVSLVVTERDATASLEKLREAGVLHLEKKTVSSGPLDSLLARRADLGRAIGLLRRYTPPRGPDGQNQPAGPHFPGDFDPEHDDLVRSVFDLAGEKKRLSEELLHQIREKRRIESWGEFDPEAFDLFAENGITLIPCVIPLAVYHELGDEVKVIPLSQDKRGVRALAVDRQIQGALPFILPEDSLSGIEKRLSGLRRFLNNIETALARLAVWKGILEKELGEIKEKIEFETARAGMETLALSADSAESVQSTDFIKPTVSWLSGFVPEDKVGLLKRAAAENGWALLSKEIEAGDRPPTLVRNNPAVRIIQPLFSFLGTVPGYREYDISNSYLVFFCLFFAMIFGDAAYGLLLLIASLTAGLVFKKKKGVFPDAVKLFMLLSLCTVAWGAVTGSWFAIHMENLPAFLRSLVLSPFDNSGPLAPFPAFLRKLFPLPAEAPLDSLKTRWNIQYLCFTVGSIQLIYGRTKNIKKLLPSLTALAQAGWLIMMIGLYFLVLYMLLKVEMPFFAVYLIAAGLALYFIFAEQRGGNFFINIGKSFTNFLSIFLNAVGSFADIISYIRLFAVGLAGSIIAQSFNSMAIPVEGFGGLGAAFFLRLLAAVLILIFGHALNLVMNALSVVVHGVRLNLLEYAGNHLGMEWSGYAYNPFALPQKKNEP